MTQRDDNRELGLRRVEHASQPGLEVLAPRLFTPVANALANHDPQQAVSGLQAARRALPCVADLALKEVLTLRLRYLAWEVELEFEAQHAWRGATAAALADLARPQYTRRGELEQVRLRLQLGLRRELLGLGRLPRQEFEVLYACLPQEEFTPELLELVRQWETRRVGAAVAPRC